MSMIYSLLTNKIDNIALQVIRRRTCDVLINNKLIHCCPSIINNTSFNKIHIFNILPIQSDISTLSLPFIHYIHNICFMNTNNQFKNNGYF